VVQSELTDALPEKEQIDFDFFHSRNQRSMPLPLTTNDATYAVDDLHRIEAILRSQTPNKGSFASAKLQTLEIANKIMMDPHGVNAIQDEYNWLLKKKANKAKGKGKGKGKVKGKEAQLLSMAVEIKRSVLTMPNDVKTDFVKTVEEEVDNLLGAAKVHVAEDLSFNPR